MLAYSSNVGTITDRRAARRGEAVRLPARVRPRASRPARACPARPAGRLLPPDEWSGSSLRVGADRARASTPPRCRWPPRYAAIANDGTYVQPHLVKEIIGPDGEASPRRRRRPTRGAQPGERRRAAHDAGGGGDRRRRHRPAGRDPRLPGRRQDRHRLAAGQRQAAATARSASFIGMAPADDAALRDRGLRAHARRRRRRRSPARRSAR